MTRGPHAGRRAHADDTFAHVISPFPWHALPRVAPTHVRAAARVRRAFPTVRTAAIAQALSGLVGHPVTLDVRRVGAAARVDLGGRGALIVLGEPGSAVAIEVEAELALAVASALAGGGLPRVARGRGVDPEVAGAIAGVLQWLAREAGVEAPVLAIDPPRDALPSLGLEVLTIDVAVKLGVLRATVRVAVSVPELDRTPAFSAIDALHRLGDTPLTLPVVIAHGTARAGDLADLRAGDVIVVDHRLDGCALVAPAARAGVQARGIEPREGRVQVRIEGGPVELAAAAAPSENVDPMTDETGATMQLPALEEGARLAEDLAELPLAVRVEIGSATLAAREWAALGPGDVVVLDRRVGDAVSLRIGGKVLARGELVEVDGAVGVRITERTS
ncbi:MAG: FliM/FliN family flagellar motor switch protein [Deltaproteobacteria bacterium]|nr:FliM/FliN family flagellar motor switch protein [Deltaproteobacteria bacterium]